LFSLQLDDDLEEILTEMPTYIYTGEDATDVVKVKQLLVEVYLKNSQLMAHLQNLLELG
jgi:muconolactone delta-isomerase